MKFTYFKRSNGLVYAHFAGDKATAEASTPKGCKLVEGHYDARRYAFLSGDIVERAVEKPESTSTHEPVWDEEEYGYIMKPRLSHLLVAAIKQQTKEAVQAPVSHAGELYDAGTESVQAMLSVIAFIDLTGELPDNFTGWRDHNNNLILTDATPEQVKSALKDLFVAIQNRNQSLLAKSWSEQKMKVSNEPER